MNIFKMAAMLQRVHAHASRIQTLTMKAMTAHGNKLVEKYVTKIMKATEEIEKEYSKPWH